jgi:hypothetical protein
MPESIEHCKLCGSLCRRGVGKDGDCYYAPFLEHAETPEAKDKLAKMLRDAKFCQHKLERAVEALKHVGEFLQSKGHKIMYLQVKETLRMVEETSE